MSISNLQRYLDMFSKINVPRITFILILIFLDSKIFSQSGWIQENLINNQCIGINFPSKDTGYIFQRYGELYKSTNRGNNWFIVNTGISFMGKGKFTTTNLGIVLGLPSKLTTNAGLNWSEVSNNLPGIGAVNIADQQLINANTGYYVGIDFYPLPMPCCYDGVIYKTTNSGANWIEVYRHAAEQLQEVKFKDENNGIALDHIALVSTTNAGSNWIYNSNIFNDVRYFFARSMSDPFKDTIYIAGFISGDTAAVIKSTNRGNSWFKSLQLSYLSRLRKIFFIDNNTGYAVGDSGLIVKTTNGGNNWTVLNSETRKQLNGVWFINKDTGFVVGDSGLVLKTYTGGLVSINNGSKIIPDKFKLHQNYPNPFNPTTKINFEIPNDGIVTLSVFDNRGKLVSTPVSGFKLAGSYAIKFNASNLASGVYFYKVEYNVEGQLFNKILKMLFVK